VIASLSSLLAGETPNQSVFLILVQEYTVLTSHEPQELVG